MRMFAIAEEINPIKDGQFYCFFNVYLKGFFGTTEIIVVFGI